MTSVPYCNRLRTVDSISKLSLSVSLILGSIVFGLIEFGIWSMPLTLDGNIFDTPPTQIELYALSTTTQPQYNGRRCTETDLKLIAYVRSASEKHLLPYDNSVEQM